MSRAESLNIVLVVAFVSGALFLLFRFGPQKAAAQRFELLRADSYNQPLSLDGTHASGWDAVAFDTATGQVCITNSQPLLATGGPIMIQGPDGRPEPLIDPATGRPQTRRLPSCSDLAKH